MWREGCGAGAGVGQWFHLHNVVGLGATDHDLLDEVLCALPLDDIVPEHARPHPVEVDTVERPLPVPRQLVTHKVRQSLEHDRVDA